MANKCKLIARRVKRPPRNSNDYIEFGDDVFYSVKIKGRQIFQGDSIRGQLYDVAENALFSLLLDIPSGIKRPSKLEITVQYKI